MKPNENINLKTIKLTQNKAVETILKIRQTRRCALIKKNEITTNLNN